jgi:polysaccharide pyruvyl transferase WcaK-like protein
MAQIKLFIGYYGMNNIGDDLMIKVLYDSPSYVFLQGENTYDFIASEKQLILTPKPLTKLFQKIVHLIVLKAKGCNQVVFGGGTQFSSFSKLFTQLDTFLVILTCRMLNMRVTANAVGIGDLSKRNIFLIAAFKMMKQITVRDQTSSKKLTKVNIENKVVKDLVYSLDLVPLSVEKKYTLITATGSVLKLNEKFTQNYFKFLETYIGEKEKNIAFCVFQSGEDDYLYEVLKKKYPNLERIELDSSIEKIQEVFSKTKTVIGMRYHSLILADMFDIPFKGFSYDDKVKDLCSLKNMPFHAT